MDDRFNTIAGWVLFAGIVALGSSIVAGEMFHSERPEQMGYPIEGVELEGEGGAAAEEPIAVYLAKADVAKGEAVFKKCAACHNADQGGANQLGPNLWGTMGKNVAGHPGFAYSEALKSKGGSWTWDAMSAWLKSPKSYAKGTKMTFAGLGNPEDRANVMAWLNTKGSNLPLPAAPAPGTPAGESKDDAAAKQGTGPGDGPQKAETEPVLNEQQANKSKMNLDGDGASKATGPESNRTQDPR
jgi:cytochrome c